MAFLEKLNTVEGPKITRQTFRPCKNEKYGATQKSLFYIVSFLPKYLRLWRFSPFENGKTDLINDTQSHWVNFQQFYRQNICL